MVTTKRGSTAKKGTAKRKASKKLKRKVAPVHRFGGRRI